MLPIYYISLKLEHLLEILELLGLNYLKIMWNRSFDDLNRVSATRPTNAERWNSRHEDKHY